MQVNKTYKVTVIDEILVSRTGLCFLINKLPNFTAEDFQNHYNNAARKDRAFDVLLYSTRSVDKEVLHKLKKIKEKWQELPIVVLAPGISRAEQFDLVNLEISGLIIQEATRLALKESLLCAVNNGIYFPEPIMAVLKDNSRRPLNGHMVKAAFSDMHKEILQLLASGLTTPMVAERLFRSVRTIEWHKEKMMKIAKVRSTSQLLLFALDYGIIDSPFENGEQIPPTSEVREREHLYLS